MILELFVIFILGFVKKKQRTTFFDKTSSVASDDKSESPSPSSTGKAKKI